MDDPKRKSANKSAADKNKMKLFLSGDVMTGRGIDQILPYSVDPTLYEHYVTNAKQYVQLAERHSGPLPAEISHSYIWGDALEVLQKAKPNLRIINLETAVTTSDEYWSQKRIHYRMHPKNIPVLTEADIGVCVLSNNHILDWGYQGLAETLEILEKHNIGYAGAGTTNNIAAAPATMETKNGRLLVFAFATTDAGIPLNWKAETDRPGINLLEDLDTDTIKRVTNDISVYKKPGDRLVISIHWGGNWGYEIPKSHRKFAHNLIDAGADLIHGHSSHHPKSIEVYKGRLILYGCGDLINDYEGIRGYEEYRDDLSLLYFPLLDSSGKLLSLEMTPMKIKRFRLTSAENEDRQWLRNRLNKECKRFDTSIDISDKGFILSW